ncbi:FUSC family protein [Sinomonas sp. ASV322]|nr:FUSC family protein [Sinomonas sp. ASV322]MDQ4502520.1 FUSC family protein [Sinomonas sp. ASV322]
MTTTIGDPVRAARTPAGRLSRLGPPGRDWHHARRVAVGLAVPGLALIVAGRPDLMICAVFGSFTGMYGRAESRGLRLRHQLQAGGVLVAGVGLGVLLAAVHAAPWVLVLTEVCFAFAGALVTNRLGLVPQGPFFGVFALGAMASVPPDRVAPWVAVLICLASVLFAVLVGYAGGTRVGVVGAQPPADDDGVARPVVVLPGDSASLVRDDGRPILHAVVNAGRYALAISVAGAVGVLLGLDHANWAMAAAIVPLAAADPGSRLHPGLRSVVHRSLHRVLGTLVGLAVTALLLVPRLEPLWLALIVVALLFPTELFMGYHYGLALAFFTPLILVMTELAKPAEPFALLRDRGIDNLLGVAIGVAVAVFVRGPRSAAAAAD